jgi:hypothetical protein
MRYVVLAIAVEAADDGELELSRYDVLLQDAQGRLWSPESVPRPTDAKPPELESQTLSPGDRVSGIIGYSLPADAPIARVLFQPTSDQLITLADVVPGPGPAAGTAVDVTLADGASARVTASVADPYTGFEPDRPPAPDQRYVVVTLRMENTGDRRYGEDYYDVTLVDVAGHVHGYAPVPRPDDDPVPDLGSVTLAPGDRISGAIGFVVPSGARLARVLYAPESARLVTLAELTGSGRPAASPAPPTQPPQEAPTSTPGSTLELTPAPTPPPAPGPSREPSPTPEPTPSLSPEPTTGAGH